MIITPVDPELNHTLILSGEIQAQELLDGHSDHINCELGVQREVFKELICILPNTNTMDCKYVFWKLRCWIKDVQVLAKSGMNSQGKSSTISLNC